MSTDDKSFEPVNETSVDMNQVALYEPALVKLEFKNIIMKSKEKIILNDISGCVKPGEVLALMGPSGSGKTSLLNLLSHRRELLGVSSKNIQGELLLNGKDFIKKDRKKIGYVMQQDIFFETLTLKETLWFYAKVRLPRSLNTEQKIERVHELLKLMDLEHCLNTLIGGGLIRGLSGGERKRASIILEMITNPSILFLDEPTSGLDSTMSMVVVKSLQNLALQKHKTIICSIHQPNSQIFYCFSKLLLLAEGQIAYYGSIQDLFQFFESLGYPCPYNWNMADHMIDMVRSEKEIVDKIVVEGTKKLKHLLEFEKDQSDIYPKAPQVSSKKNKVSNINKSSYKTQFIALTRRSFLRNVGEKWNIINLLEYIITAVIAGLVYFQIKRTDLNLINYFGLIFYCSIYFFIDPFFVSILELPKETVVIKKEYMSGMYPLSAYYFAKTIGEIPFLFVRPIITWPIIYFLSGLSPSIWFLASLLSSIYSAFLGQVIGLMIGSLGLSFDESIAIAVVYFVLNILLGGYYNKELVYWLEWIKYLSPVHYAYTTQMWMQSLYDNGVVCVNQTLTTANPSLRVPSPFESCNNNKLFATSIELMRYSGVVIDVGYYSLMALGLLIIAHLATYFFLRQTLNQTKQRKSIIKVILEKMAALNKGKKKNMLGS